MIEVEAIINKHVIIERENLWQTLGFECELLFDLIDLIKLPISETCTLYPYFDMSLSINPPCVNQGRSIVNGTYALTLVEQSHGAIVAYAGFDVLKIGNKRFMGIMHTPQGVKLNEIPINHQARNTFIKSNFRKLMLSGLVQFAKDQQLNGVLLISAQNHPKVCKNPCVEDSELATNGMISFDTGIRIIDKVAESVGFSYDKSVRCNYVLNF